LYGIDCPETEHGKKFKKGQPFGQEAMRYVEETILNKTISVEFHEKDRFNRMVSLIRYQGKNINQELIARGLAYSFNVFGRPHLPWAVEAEKSAREAKLGLWSLSATIRPQLYRRFLGLQKISATYGKESVAIRPMSAIKIAVFTKAEELEKGQKALLTQVKQSGLKYIPIVIRFTEENVEKIAFQLIGKIGDTDLTIGTIPMGRYFGMINRQPISEEDFTKTLAEYEHVAVGSPYDFEWIPVETLQKNNLPENETLYEKIVIVE
jgi:hypothetical protein